MTTKTVWWRRFVFLLAAMLYAATSSAQAVKVRAGFIKDSTRVGDEILFWLASDYSRSQQIIFPDSTFIFSPFELTKKDYFPTVTVDTLSRDSAIYRLRTFEIERLQTLRLPVFIINALDCTRVFSNRDTIALNPAVADLPDSLTETLPLKPTTAYQHVSSQINIPLIIVVVSFLAILSGIGWFVFGPAINRYYKIRRLRTLHEAFSASYERRLTEVRTNFTPAKTEAAIIEWKTYMEKVSRKPYTKLTSRETAFMQKDESLGKTLRTVDSAIYGSNTQVVDSLESLKSYADQYFNRIITEVKNG